MAIKSELKMRLEEESRKRILDEYRIVEANLVSLSLQIQAMEQQDFKTEFSVAVSHLRTVLEESIREPLPGTHWQACDVLAETVKCLDVVQNRHRVGQKVAERALKDYATNCSEKLCGSSPLFRAIEIIAITVISVVTGVLAGLAMGGPLGAIPGGAAGLFVASCICSLFYKPTPLEKAVNAVQKTGQKFLFG